MIDRQFGWVEDFEQEGALWQMHFPDEPHVRTSTGSGHVDAYFNSDIIVSRPDVVDTIVNTTLLPVLENGRYEPDWVFTYGSGLIVASACARAVGARCGYAVPAEDYRTTFKIASKSDVLVVCDDIYSGGAVKKTIERVKSIGANLLPIVFTLANLSGSERLGEEAIVAAARIPTNHYPGDNCPLCRNGSEAVEARPNWERLLAHTL